MGYTQVDSSGGHGSHLSELFTDHPKVGNWYTLAGTALTPPELSYDVQDSNDGPDRLNQEVAPVGWLQHGPVMSGEFSPDALTRGTDKHMPK